MNHEVVPREEYFTWEEDESFQQLYVRALPVSYDRVSVYNDFVSFAVSQDGYNRIAELENVIGQMRMYIQERLDYGSKICYNPSHDVI